MTSGADTANTAKTRDAANVASKAPSQDSASLGPASAGSAQPSNSGIPAREVAIVVPCFNESEVIGSSLARLREWFPDALLVVIDDGSADETYARAEAVARVDSRIVVSKQPANGGKGRAVAAAAPFTTGYAVVIADADLAYERAPIQRAIDALATADIAIGSRRHPQSTYVVPVRLFGFLYRRHVMGHLFNLVVRVALGLDLRDTQCGLKAFRAQAFADIMSRLRTAGFAFDLDVLLLARGLGFRISEVPVDVTMATGRSSVRLLRDGLMAIKEVAILARRRLTNGYSRERLR
jgi:glycosyltransferase involved in cell wall biosynthesis